jgi:hypothetical protein
MIQKILFNKYVQENLASNEFVVYETTKHWINFFNQYLLVALFLSFVFKSLIFIPITLIVNFIRLYIVINTDECILTNKRVVFKTGIIFTETLELNLSKIESLSVKRDLLGTILGYGTIIIRGTGGTVETFEKINKPLEIRKKIQEYSF